MALSTTQYGYIIDPMVPFTDGKGNTIKDGFVRVFVAGSSTPVITYRNFDGATNQDLIELDNSGRTKTSVIGSKGLTYKVCVYDKHHSQESPILTVDKVSVIGANITAGTGATVVTGLDGLTTKPNGFVDASVIGTDGYVALDHTLVTDDLNTDAKVTAVEEDRYIPLLNDDVNDPDSKMTLGRLWKWVLGNIKSLSTTITAFRTGDVIPVDGPDGTAKMSKDDLLAVMAQNVLAGTKDISHALEIERICDVSWENGYVNKNNGGILPYVSYKHTNYILISDGVVASLKNGFMGGDAGWAIYDKNKTFISGGASSDVTITNTNAVYIRFSNDFQAKPSPSVSVKYEADANVSTKYDSIDVGTLQSDVSDVKVFDGFIDFVSPTWYSGEFINKNSGIVQTLSNFERTDYIPVKNGNVVVFNFYGIQDAGYAVYNKNKGYLYGGTIASNSQTKTITISNANAAYIRLTNFIGSNARALTHIEVHYSSDTSGLYYTLESVGKEVVGKYTPPHISGKETPIVTFVYDDGASTDDWVIEQLNDHGLFGSFALMGNVGEPSSWTYNVRKYGALMKQGHSVICHGPCGGLSLTQRGGSTLNIDTINESDKLKDLRGTIASFKRAGFPVNGFVNFNDNAYSERAAELFREFFDFVIFFDNSKDGVNLSGSDFYKLYRYITDYSDMLTGAIAAVDKALGKNCVLIFGGHSAQINTNAKKADFISLLDYIKEKVDNGEMIAMNCNDAVNEFRSRLSARKATTSTTMCNVYGDSKVEGGAFKVCTTDAEKARWNFAFSGTATESGTLTLTLPTDNNGTNVTITASVTSGDTAEDVCNAVYTDNVFKYHSVALNANNTLQITRSKGQSCGSPSVSSVAGLSVTITTIHAGTDAVWTS